MVLDATVAGPEANSYLTVEMADELAAVDYGPEREWWLDAGGEDKALVLMRATSEIDDALLSSWTRYSSAQALLFPRENDYTTAPVAAFIPARVRRATYYQAAFLIRNAKVISAADTRRARSMQSASEPNVSYTRPNETEAPVLSSRALQVLEGYGQPGGDRAIHSIRVSSGYAW